MPSYDVYVQRRAGQEIKLVGSVRGLTPVLALHNAKEVFTRRDPCTRIVVRARDGQEAEHVFGDTAEQEELLKISYGKAYRQPAFFSRKWQGRDVGRVGEFNE